MHTGSSLDVRDEWHGGQGQDRQRPGSGPRELTFLLPGPAPTPWRADWPSDKASCKRTPWPENAPPPNRLPPNALPVGLATPGDRRRYGAGLDEWPR